MYHLVTENAGILHNLPSIIHTYIYIYAIAINIYVCVYILA